MTTTKSKVFIALPVYNNVKYIRRSLDSLLNQSYKNIAIHIFDNHSTDGTSEICKLYSKKNNKLEYHYNSTNQKAAENFRKALFEGTKHKNDYFMYARGDSTISKNLVMDLVNALETDKRASLAFPKMKWVDESGIEIKNKKNSFYDTRGQSIATRISLLLMTKPNQIYGLFRTSMVAKFYTKNWWQTIGYDHIFLFELALKGHFLHLEEGSFFRLYKYYNEPLKQRMQRYRDTVLIKPDILDKSIPLIKIPFYLIQAILYSSLNIRKKFECITIVLLLAPLRFLISKDENI